MSFYDDHCLPHLIHCACGLKGIQSQRAKVVPAAEGRVLEIGMGSALNIPFYDPAKVELVWGLEPSRAMRKKARRNLARAPFEVRLLELPGEEIPLDDNSVDTVLLTYTLCTIPDWRSAMQQMRRVLRPGGKVVFCEHGAAPEERLRKWQDRINPLWKKIAGGCNLNRPIPDCIEAGGFNIQSLETGYLPGSRFAAFNYRGIARQT
ncbi:MAG: class I SAM-dependent methyltransferase [Thiogranum sp.]